MAIVQTNTNYMKSLNSLSGAQKRVSTALEQLSSGSRINSAKDDAAGQAIANRMTSNLRAYDKLTQGINDGIGLAQVAESGLDSINKLVQRSRELAVKAANGTLSDSDRSTLNKEFQQLRGDIDRIATGTTVFGKYPLAPASNPATTTPASLGNTASLATRFPVSGSSNSFNSGIVSTAYIPAGATNVTLTIDSLSQDDDIQLFARDGTHLVGTPLQGSNPDSVWTGNGIVDAASATSQVLTTDNGFLASASYDGSSLVQGGASQNLGPGGSASGTYHGMTFTYSGDGDRYESGSSYNDGLIQSASPLERVNIDKTTEDLVLMVVGSGSFTATATWDSMPGSGGAAPAAARTPTSSDTRVMLDAAAGGDADFVTIKATPADSTALKLDKVALDPLEEARKALAAFDQALGQIDDYRSQYGALANRFDSAIANIAQTSIATSQARSQILDTDYAQTVNTLTIAQIQSSSATEMLKQANTSQDTVMQLLRSSLDQ